MTIVTIPNSTNDEVIDTGAIIPSNPLSPMSLLDTWKYSNFVVPSVLYEVSTGFGTYESPFVIPYALAMPVRKRAYDEGPFSSKYLQWARTWKIPSDYIGDIQLNLPAELGPHHLQWTAMVRLQKRKLPEIEIHLGFGL